MIVDNRDRRKQERAWAKLCYATARSMEEVGRKETIEALKQMLTSLRKNADLGTEDLIRGFDVTAKKFR